MRIDNEVGNVQLMQKINRLKVLDYIRKEGPAARPEIAKATRLSPSSITNIVTYLLERKLVAEVGRVDSKEVGRKATLVKFNPESMSIISIDIEAANVNVAITNLEGDILRMKKVPLKRTVKDFEILNIIKKEISTIMAEGASPAVAGIGIAVSGLVDDSERLIISSSMRWKGLSLKEYFEESFHLPVYVQDISRTKALWELRTRKDVTEKNVVFLDLTMGVGMINFYEQKINSAVIGELGHTTVKKDGPLCFCGNHGCLEMMCSVDSIINQADELVKSGRCEILRDIMEQENAPLSYDILLKAFEKGDKDVYGVLEECGIYLGIGLANTINMFNPQRIIINGDVLLECSFIYETAVSEAMRRAHEQFIKDLKIEKVDIGDEEAVKGISLYVTDKLFELSGPEF